MTGKIGKLLGNAYLDFIGWTLVGEKPAFKKYVVVAAPHTSNWDLPIMLATGAACEITFSWMMKHTVFWGPLGILFDWLGGVPIERTSSHSVVGQLVKFFDSREEFVVVIPPEGTRSYTDYWKSGFYYIAKEASVPIVLGLVDFSRKQCGFGPVIWPTDDLLGDMEKIREYYSDKKGLFPENFGPVTLRDELAARSDKRI